MTPLLGFETILAAPLVQILVNIGQIYELAPPLVLSTASKSSTSRRWRTPGLDGQCHKQILNKKRTKTSLTKVVRIVWNYENAWMRRQFRNHLIAWYVANDVTHLWIGLTCCKEFFNNNFDGVVAQFQVISLDIYCVKVKSIKVFDKSYFDE